MRRMITNKQVVDIVNKGIEEGEIEAGGVSPEQKAVLDQISYDDENDSINIVAPLYVMENDAVAVGFAVETLEEDAQEAQIVTDFNLNIVGAGDIKVNGQDILVAPETAPAAQQLVGINTSGEQNALSIGDGLVVEDNVLKTKILVVDFNNDNQSITVGSTVASNVQSFYYDLVVVKNYKKIGSQYYGMVFVKTYDSGIKYESVTNVYQRSTSQNVGLKIKNWLPSLTSNVTNGTISININQDDFLGKKEIQFVGNSGTITNSSDKAVFNDRYVDNFVAYWKESSSSSALNLIRWVEFTTAATGNFVGIVTRYVNDALTDYKLVINKADYTWTLTAI